MTTAVEIISGRGLARVATRAVTDSRRAIQPRYATGLLD